MKTKALTRSASNKTSPPRSGQAKIRKILTTTDFSPESLLGLDYARDLGEKLGATVLVLHVVEPPSRFSGMENVPFARTTREVAALADTQLDKLLEHRRKDNARVTGSVRIGKPFDQITRAAGDIGADLIVIATHGYTGAKHVLLGSTSERVVRHANCPVLTVRTGSRSPAASCPKRILVPIDFSKLSADALPWAILFARQFAAEIVLLHVVEKFPIDYTVTTRGGMVENLQKQAAADLGLMADSVAKSSGVRVGEEVCTGKPYEQICETAKARGADLIVLTTHGHTGLKHVWLGSTAERVVRHATCPVLVVRKRIR